MIHLVKNTLIVLCITMAVHLLAIKVHAAEPIIWQLWPGEKPGGNVELPPEYDRTKPDDKLYAGRPIIRLTNVTKPTLVIFKPNKEIDTGTAIIIAPGGGNWILGYDLEGTEVAEWFNSIGVTAIVLKYRVPGIAFNKDKKWLAAAQDGQRAVSLVRGRAAELGIKADKIGIIGFSAGGIPVAYTTVIKERIYQPVDQYDEVSFTANFAAPIYMGGIPPNATISKESPPFFMVVAHDDKDMPLNMVETYIALKKAGASAELHIYESGGHAFGVRKTGLPVASWPERMKEWMIRLKLL
ncbi:alpha/beta hydrolase [Colwellia piezophila]|uniref:alpha/beta hydrolase n=1 Tax=Colwellia piezophila TaxID=211668 RepID=UPI00036D657F|nr:alpha/beta hydrolase [Colwellia piezophila]